MSKRVLLFLCLLVVIVELTLSDELCPAKELAQYSSACEAGLVEGVSCSTWLCLAKRLSPGCRQYQQSRAKTMDFLEKGDSDCQQAKRIITGAESPKAENGGEGGGNGGGGNGGGGSGGSSAGSSPGLSVLSAVILTAGAVSKGFL